MMQRTILAFTFLLASTLLWASCSCNNKTKNTEAAQMADTLKADSATTLPQPVYRGLYSFGPEVRTFQDCGRDKEFWVADSSAQLELQYSQLNFEKPYEPVYIVVEGDKVAAAGQGKAAGYDSMLVVRKLLQITRDIPKTNCP